MKHSLKIILILLGMFFITQLIGILVIYQYSPQVSYYTDEQGNTLNKTTYNLPYGMDPPEDVTPAGTLVSIIIAIFIAVILMLILMRYKAEFFLRAWFFIVVTLALAITINAFIFKIQYAAIIAIIIAIPLALIKLFKRNIIVHNITELFIGSNIDNIYYYIPI